MAVSLKSITLRGYKSYRELVDFELGRITVLIGPNGSGKSNLVSFFQLFKRMTGAPGEFQFEVARHGGADAFLFDGAKRTPSFQFEVRLAPNKTSRASYSADLFFAGPERLLFGAQRCKVTGGGRNQFAFSDDGPNADSILNASGPFSGASMVAAAVRSFAKDIHTYQFHDTGDRSPMRIGSLVGESLPLRSDGGNLSAFLHRLQSGTTDQRRAFRRIVDTARLVLPFLAELVLQPEGGRVLLRWREAGSDRVFDASQASDGTLRMLALTALLCQPVGELPSIVILDEPELGLHPQAVTVLGSMIRSASVQAQVIVATQSVPLLDEFAIEDIVVVERPGRETMLRRLKPHDFAAWIEEYSPGDLWRLNLLNGVATE